MIPDHAKRIHWLSSFRYVAVGAVGAAVLYGNAAPYMPDVDPVVVMLVSGSVTIGLAMLFGVIRWRRFRYWIQDRSIRSVSGGLVKKEIEIPFDKIQAINVTSPIVYRLVGLKRVSVKTAAAGTQLELTAVSALEADRFRAQIENKEAKGNPAETDAESEVVTREPAATRKLSTVQIMVAAATSRKFFVALAGVNFAAHEFDDVFQFRLVESLAKSLRTEGFSLATFNWLYLVAGVAILLIAWLVTIAYTALVFRSFQVQRTDEKSSRIKIRRGLGEIQEVEIPLRRVQAISFVQTPLQLLLRYGSIQMSVIGHAEEKGKKTVLFPCIAVAEWQEFLDEIAPGFAISRDPERAPSRALPLFVLRASGVRLAVFMVVAYAGLIIAASAWIVAVVALVLVALSIAIGLINFRVESIALAEENATVVIQKWSRTTIVIRRDAAQQQVVRQDLFQRKLGLATFGMMIANGAVGETHVVYDLPAMRAEGFIAWVQREPTQRKPHPDTSHG